MSQPRICPNCRAAVPTDAPEGVCPACALRAGFDIGGGSDSPTRAVCLSIEGYKFKTVFA